MMPNAVATFFRGLRDRMAGRASLLERIDRLENRILAERARRNGVSSGTEMTMGRYTREDVADMRGAKLWDTLDAMENDPHVKGQLRSATLPLLNGDWDIVPASDSQRDKEIAAFCKANLLRKADPDFPQFGSEYWCTTSWRQRLSEHLRCVRDGYSISQVTTRRVGGKRVYDRIHWLEPRSVDPQGWVLDAEDNLVAVKRTYNDPTMRYYYLEPLPVSDIVIFVHEMAGARYDGRSIWRSSFGAWLRKTSVQRDGAIWAHKAGAPLPVVGYPAGSSQDQIDRWEEFARSLRGTANTEGWLSYEMASDGTKPHIEYIGATNQIERGLVAIIDSENREISHGGPGQMDMLGETETGSRALGESKGDKDDGQVEALCAEFSDQFNHGAGNLRGMIERLVDENYAGARGYPELQKVDDTAEIETMLAAWEKGVTPKIAEARKQIAERVGHKLPEDAYEVEELPPAPVGPSIPAADGGRDQQQPAPRPTGRVAASDATFRERLDALLEPVQGGRPRNGGRFPNRLETEVVRLAEVSEALRVGERDAVNALREIRAEMTDELLGRLRDGKITARNLESQRRSAFRGGRKARGAIGRVIRSIGETGWRHAREEIERL